MSVLSIAHCCFVIVTSENAAPKPSVNISLSNTCYCCKMTKSGQDISGNRQNIKCALIIFNLNFNQTFHMKRNVFIPCRLICDQRYDTFALTCKIKG